MTKGGFPVMAKIPRIRAANICRQFSFVINTAASTRCLVENFQLICYERLDACSGDTLVAACTRKKSLQTKMTKGYYWIGVQENIGMFSKS